MAKPSYLNPVVALTSHSRDRPAASFQLLVSPSLPIGQIGLVAVQSLQDLASPLVRVLAIERVSKAWRGRVVQRFEQDVSHASMFTFSKLPRTRYPITLLLSLAPDLLLLCGGTLAGWARLA
jgi:hypothetical protein